MFIRKIAGVSIAATVGLTAASAAAQTKWDMPTGYPPTNFHTENIQVFADDVKAVTGGKLLITVHAGASLFKVPEIKRAVQSGQAQIGELLLSNLENENPLYGADVVPFLAASYGDALKLWKAQKPAIEKKLDAQGLKLLFVVPWPPQGIYTKKDINSAADLKGIKFRAYNVATTRLAELTGMVPVTIQAAELPQALATGVVQSFISSGSTGYDSKAWESLTHFYDTQAWLPKNIVFVNKEAFGKLDAATQEAVLKASAKAEEAGWKLSQEKTAWYLDQLKAKGMKVQPPSEALKSDLRKVGDQLTDDWLKKAGDEGKSVVDAYRKM
ncbi:TRAP transporter substrate-binding protein [Reyranella sp. CPCC 100927]|uniref:TRAP transporter substrate-binding protein n=1 Tax=Reyranella sp. CPCC 100927 TaxID=2599616 RepID=UPI0011B43C4F|nr:TRAP transporter substrate-binding protein [Reyranella sp. CPCC 100927]TWT13647.1 TRAP transporter substrate-binding protein [Reyranella sp. CPCC 100927]